MVCLSIFLKQRLLYISTTQDILVITAYAQKLLSNEFANVYTCSRTGGLIFDTSLHLHPCVVAAKTRETLRYSESA